MVDLSLLIDNFGKEGTYITDLAGVTITFNTGQTISPDSDGFVTIPQGATSFTVKRNGNPIGAMGIFYGPRKPPIAYSTTFDFTVPAYTGGDVGKEVWYYILARLYVPSGLSGQSFYFVATADYCVQNVKMNGYSKTGSGSSVNIDLGKLGGGYHLLEFEFVDVSGGGSLSFHVATATSQYAWLSRFRTYVPNYSNNEYKYIVGVWTTFSMEDDYYLIGYANDSIEAVCTDGLLWDNWTWNLGSENIYAWGDGFSYPLGRRLRDYSVWVNFTFVEIQDDGLLDFQVVSWTFQQDRIRPPRFYACANIMNLGSHITLNEGKIYGGSRWDEPDKPEISERTYEIRTTYDASYDDGTDWFNAELEAGVGNWWAEWGLTKGTQDDVGIPLNFTVRSFSSNRPTGLFWGVYCYWKMYLKDYTIDVYSFPSLHITGMEADTGDSKGKIKADLTIALDFEGTVLMTVSGLLDQPIGIIVGLGIKGIAAAVKYVQGQEVSRYDQTIQESNHWQLKSTENMWVCSDPNGPKNVSDLVFLGLDPTAGKACGLTEAVLKGTLQATYWKVFQGYPPIVIRQDYPIGDIEISLYIPWFLWP
jgi:hypothetical protein